MEIFVRLRNIQELYKKELFRLADDWYDLKSKFSKEYQIAYKEYKDLNKELSKVKSKTQKYKKMSRPESAFTSNTSFNFRQTKKLGIYPDEDYLKIEFRCKNLKKQKGYYQKC